MDSSGVPTASQPCWAKHSQSCLTCSAALTEAVSAGDTTIKADDITIFSVNDRVVFAQGSADEETRTVVQIATARVRARRNTGGTLTLNSPVSNNHATTVRVERLPPIPPSPPTGGGGGGGGSGKKSNTGLIVGLSLAAVVIIGVGVFLAVNSSPRGKGKYAKLSQF